MSGDKIDIEEIEKIIIDAGKCRVIIFLNCQIENITIHDTEIKIEGGDHNHHYNITDQE